MKKVILAVALVGSGLGLGFYLGGSAAPLSPPPTCSPPYAPANYIQITGPLSMPAAVVGQQYSFTWSACSAANGAVSWVTSQPMPNGVDGMTWAGNLTLSGVPQSTGAFPLDFTISDGQGDSMTANYYLVVQNTPPPTTTTSTVPPTTTTTTTVPPTTTTTTTPSTATLGMFYKEGGPSNNLPAIASFASSSGIHIHLAQDFVDGTSCGGLASQAGANANFYSTFTPTYQMVFPYNMVDSSGNACTSQAAAIGQALVNNGEANAIIRIGWEFNGNWFPWGCQFFTPTGFVADWRTIVNGIRSVPGQAFKFEWNPTLGDPSCGLGDLLVNGWYPGDSYVDYVATDIYDNQSFSTQQTETDGLNWLADLASTHHKQIMFGEWGLWFGDDAAWLTSTGNWGVQHNAIMMWWNDANNGVDSTQYPDSVAAVKALNLP